MQSSVVFLQGAVLVVAALILSFCCFFIMRKYCGKRTQGLLTSRAISRFIFVCIIYVWLPKFFAGETAINIARFLGAITVAFGAYAFTRVVSWAQVVAHEKTGDKLFSSKTFAQVATILIWAAALIIIISLLLGKSPALVLSGFGALTAVLMLIFKDSILGLVAGIQVAQNDMVRIGDWITIEKLNADGVVIDIALTTVKVQNFDNTVTMVPSSALISDAFINWRYMSTSKGRRIKRAVRISAMTVSPLSNEVRAALIQQKMLNENDFPISNLAAFELWLERYLKAHEEISQELPCMVRQLSSTSEGIPIEIYCFTKNRDWIAHEKITASIFNEIIIQIPYFGLSLYERTRAGK